MESLYVCLFSNGHIKVGRSVDPLGRIAAHVDRVSCMGVDLVKRFIVECSGSADQREMELISCCANCPGAQRFKSEWFAGLEYETVCAWAEHFAMKPLSEKAVRQTRWAEVISELRSMGWTHAALATECGCGAATISRLALGQQEEPMYSMGETLLRLIERRKS